MQPEVLDRENVDPDHFARQCWGYQHRMLPRGIIGAGARMQYELMKALIVGAVAAVSVAMAHAQQAAPAEQAFDQGQDDYASHCAACHGDGGAGDGPFAALLKVNVPNLATLSKRNGGTFPYSQVYETIAGKLAPPGHGTRNMPIWGQEFSYKATPRNPTPDAFVRAKINALVLHIHRLQAK
jgi:mono/diheme cytochrome c family protein